MDAPGRFDAFRALAGRRGRAGAGLVEALAAARTTTSDAPDTWAPGIARGSGLPAAAGLGAARYYADLAAPHGRRHIRVCAGTACFAAQGGQHVSDVEREIEVARDAVAADGSVSVQSVRCLGYCYAGPAALDGDTPCVGPDLVDQLARRAEPQDPRIPAVDVTGDPVLLAGIAAGAPGWQVWPWVLEASTRERIRAEVAASGLRGRGGASYPVAAKWAAAIEGAARAEARRTPADLVVVANGDEGDPGSFADRLLMEADPERVLEGLALACWACGSRQGVVLVRSEYPQALARMREAVRNAYDAGHLGVGVHGTEVTLDIEVVAGAGSYVAGEETALIASLEGARGCARPRPPYPTEHGLWNAPTVVGNVETLSALPWIVEHGGAAYARRGTPQETGTKLVCLSERFARPGCYEVEFGTPLRRIVTELGGGLRDGAELAVLQVGGPLGGFLAGDSLDVALTDTEVAARGAALGHAGLVAFDDRLDPRAVLRHIWEFAAAESCGACSPCRVGSRRGVQLATAYAESGERPDDGYPRMLNVLSQASLCAFGRRIPAAVRSLARAYGSRLAEWDR